jgi:hypothetical protein
MHIANTPVLLSLAPWIQRNATPTAVIWVNPGRGNRAPTSVPNPVLNATPADMTSDSEIIAFVVARLRKGLVTGLKFPTIRDGAHAFVLLTAAATEAAQ